MLNTLRRVLGSYADLVLVILMAGILIVLFTPIPSQLLDFLLIANFAFALLLLLLTFYMGKPVEFSTFPALLLIATLFRLSLNIAATRLILSDADAGKVINAIGHYVVGGNYVIGLMVFLILVVVQYVVVTNGAQRVAEVAARFTLDSMPGHQMSIDADLNMGLIDQTEAQKRRQDLQKEANFYGSMDGASKFVKGDAIAGLVILFINIVGGLAVGVAQLGMSWQGAFQTFTLLTVGDGIVTQVPALVIAVGTGILVTRSTSDTQLSTEILKQLTTYPRTLVMVAIALGVLLFLPGIPAMPVLALSILTIVCAFIVIRFRNDILRENVATENAKTEAAEDIYDLLTVVPVEVGVGQLLIPLANESQSSLLERIVVFRKQYAMEAGFVIPKIRIRDNINLGPNAYEIAIYGAVVAQGSLHVDRLLAIHPSGGRKGFQGIETKDPTYGLPATWVAPDDSQAARMSGCTLVEPSTVLLTHVSEIVRQQAASLLTRAETERLIERLRKTNSGLVEELIPNVLTLSEVQKVLQNLLREKVSIRNLEAVLEVLVDSGRTTKDAEMLTELVRQKLGGIICQKLAGPNGELQVLTLDPAIEQAFSTSLRAVDQKSVLVLEPKFAEQVITRLGAQVERMMKSNVMPVLLCAPELRRHVRRITERVMPHLTVLSIIEVPTGLNVRGFSMVTI